MKEKEPEIVAKAHLVEAAHADVDLQQADCQGEEDCVAQAHAPASHAMSPAAFRSPLFRAPRCSTGPCSPKYHLEVALRHTASVGEHLL